LATVPLDRKQIRKALGFMYQEPTTYLLLCIIYCLYKLIPMFRVPYVTFSSVNNFFLFVCAGTPIENDTSMHHEEWWSGIHTRYWRIRLQVSRLLFSTFRSAEYYFWIIKIFIISTIFFTLKILLLPLGFCLKKCNVSKK
jgi:hypothetical protein